MPGSERSCPKCGTAMEEGFVLDHTYGARMQNSWIGGAPEKSFWAGVKLRGREPIPIRTDRCVACGYLESYAPRP